MSYPFPPDVQQLLSQRMATGRYATEDDALREALLALSEEDQDLAAVREAIAEMEAGDTGTPLDEAVDAIRRKYRDG